MFRWQSLCLKSEALWIIPKVVEFLGSQGRMKFVRPLYRALANLQQGPGLAKDTFASFRALYHPIARKMIAQDLGVSLWPMTWEAMTRWQRTADIILCTHAVVHYGWLACWSSRAHSHTVTACCSNQQAHRKERREWGVWSARATAASGARPVVLVWVCAWHGWRSQKDHPWVKSLGRPNSHQSKEQRTCTLALLAGRCFLLGMNSKIVIVAIS